MSRNNDMGPDRGEYLLDATNTTRSDYLIGSRRVFEDRDYAAGLTGRGMLSQEPVECMLVKNTSGGALLPGQVVTFVATAPWSITAALATANDPKAYIVDEYLPAAGVPNNAVFWVVTSGPAKPLVTSSGGTAAGIPLASSATSGRADVQGTPGSATAARDHAYAVLCVLLAAAANGNSQVRARVLRNLWR
jgi:hypothetical protein